MADALEYERNPLPKPSNGLEMELQVFQLRNEMERLKEVIRAMNVDFKDVLNHLKEGDVNGDGKRYFFRGELDILEANFTRQLTVLRNVTMTNTTQLNKDISRMYDVVRMIELGITSKISKLRGIFYTNCKV